MGGLSRLNLNEENFIDLFPALQGPQPSQWGEAATMTGDSEGNFVEFDDPGTTRPGGISRIAPFPPRLFPTVNILNYELLRRLSKGPRVRSFPGALPARVSYAASFT